jgi:hypothetical protein
LKESTKGDQHACKGLARVCEWQLERTVIESPEVIVKMGADNLSGVGANLPLPGAVDLLKSCGTTVLQIVGFYMAISSLALLRL